MKRSSDPRAGPDWSDIAETAFRSVVDGGARAFRPGRHLARVLPGGQAELADHSPEGLRRTLARLAKALRSERMRGRAGHWTYDLNRHLALAQACAWVREQLKDRTA